MRSPVTAGTRAFDHRRRGRGRRRLIAIDVRFHEAPADVPSLRTQGGFEFVDGGAERVGRRSIRDGDLHEDDDLARGLLQGQQMQHAAEQRLARRDRAHGRRDLGIGAFAHQAGL